MVKLAPWTIAALQVLPLGAQAQSSSEAVLNNFSYTLIDLRPDDGIAPSLSVVKNLSSRQSIWSSTVREGLQAGTDYDEQGTTLYGRALNASIDTPPTSARVSLSATSLETLTISSAASTTRQAGSSFTGLAGGNWTNNDFVLSPGTQITFFADVSAQSSSQVPANPAFYDYARSTAHLQLTGHLPFSVEQASTIWELAVPGEAGAARSASERLSIMFSNTSLAEAAMDFTVALGSQAMSLQLPPAPVPEPATTAMLLGGLAVVAAAVRRRQIALRR